MSTDFFKDDGVFLPMLNDTARNEFYSAALKIAAPDKIVCDIGAGTGFLTVMALQSGAQHVIAVEKNPERFEYLKQNLKRVGCLDSVTLVCADFLDCDIKADVYVSETINTQILGEDMLKLSNHVQHHGGEFIPGNIEIWAEAYENHPVFTLDITDSEAIGYEPAVDVDPSFVAAISSQFNNQYSLQDTVFRANSLNRLFTMLDRFTDIKLKKLYHGMSIVLDLGNFQIEDNVVLTIPNNFKQHDWAMLVLKWKMTYRDQVLDSNCCWFGNVAKQIRQDYVTADQIEIRYNSAIRNWQLKY